MRKEKTNKSNVVREPFELTDDQLVQVWTNVGPQNPALNRVHQRLNKSSGAEAAITSYDRMHHRHNR